MAMAIALCALGPTALAESRSTLAPNANVRTPGLAGTPDPGRFAVVVGRNVGADPDRRLQHAERDAEKVAEVLASLGGFPAAQVHLLRQTDADGLRRTLRRVEHRIIAYKESTGRSALLLFYYSGHAAGFALELGPTPVAFADLRGHLERSRADVRLAFIDSCQSGGLILPKGGHRTSEVHISSVDELNSKGYAIITSSDRDELSQESEEIRGSFFSHYLVSAMRGAADVSQDSQVTLGEVYDYVYRHTVAHTGETVGGIQHPMYDFRVQGRGDIVLTRLPDRDRVVQARLPPQGRLLVLDAARKRSLLELDLRAGSDQRFALEPDRYVVFWLRAGAVRRAWLDTRERAALRLSAASFHQVELQRSVAKGGLFKHDAQRPPQRLSLSLLARNWPLADRAVAPGATLEYRVQLTGVLQWMTRVYASAHQDAGYSTGYFDVGMGAGPAYVLRRSSPCLWLGPLLSYEHLFQAPREQGPRHSPGVAYLTAAGIDFLEWQLPLFISFGAGGRIFKLAPEGWVHRVALQLAVGTGLSL